MPQIENIIFRNYKSFKNGDYKIDLKRINVLIGRNNCGKSSCIDVIEAMTDYPLFQNRQADIFCNIHLEKEETIGKQQQSGILTITSYVPNLPSLLFRIDNSRKDCLDAVPAGDSWKTINLTTQNMSDPDMANKLVVNINHYYHRFKCLRLNAERDIVPEVVPKESNSSLEMTVNGAGATNLINRILNNDEYDENLIQHSLLEALNAIMYPESIFTGITIQRVDNEKWEVFLYEDGVRYPLSKTGSGLKTIILVLLNMLVIPELQKKEAEQKAKTNHTDIPESPIYFFAFEELENNLHPALQRRLFKYIDTYIEDHPNTYVFLTTHSHVPINMYADQDDAQILHVTKENGVSSILIVDDFITKSEVLNDLDVRASDLLQSNGIIWVEGPSDRIYIKHWMEIWGGGDLREGIDYQFLYYGGRLLSHYSANAELTTEQQADEDLISILTTNRHAVIVIDSDITDNHTAINKTKERIQNEFDTDKMFCWITNGKEIENYVPYQAINSAYHCSFDSQCKSKQKFPLYIKKHLAATKAFEKRKVPFAHEVVKYITEENASILDVREKIEKIIDIIRSWTPDKQSAQN